MVMDSKDSSIEQDSNQEKLASLVADLTASKAANRQKAAEQLGKMPTGDLESLIALERSAIGDSKKEIRLAALSALGSPTYDLLSRRRTHLTPASRKLILSQIEVWIDEGILPAPLAEVLQQRYAPSVSQPAKKPGAPRASLTSTAQRDQHPHSAVSGWVFRRRVRIHRGGGDRERPPADPHPAHRRFLCDRLRTQAPPSSRQP
jgi:hypothetical protein